MANYIYHCGNKKCRQFHIAVETSLSPTDVRQLTGGSHRCGRCGQVLWFVRREDRPEKPQETNP